VVGSHSDSSDSCTLFSLDSPRHAGHMQGVLLHSLALVFTGYLQDMSAVLPSNPSTCACTPPLGYTYTCSMAVYSVWLVQSLSLRQCPFGLILCMLLYTWKFWRPLNLAIWREIAWINIWWVRPFGEFKIWRLAQYQIESYDIITRATYTCSHISLVAARLQKMETYEVDSCVHGHRVFRGI